MAEDASTNAATADGDAGAQDTAQNSAQTRTFSQEDFDREVGRRLKAQRDQFAGYDEYKQAAERLAEIEKAGQTELELVTSERDDLKGRFSGLSAENQRLRVAITKGLPADLIDRLRGETEEEMLADADKLLSLVTPARPQTGFDGGARRSAETSSIDDVIRGMAGR